jgi:branched-chain amino acid transport system ATP-binding protein
VNAVAPPLLAVQGVGHAFGGVRVLSSVTFEVPNGSLVGLIGPNGSGKTTLFNIICGFIHPLAGNVLLGGNALKSSNVVQRSRQGLVRTFQTPRVFEHLTVLENVMAGLYKCSQGGVVASMLRLPMARREMVRMEEEAASTCNDFGLGGIQQRLAGSLTAGARRNVELARAAVSKPRILLLDEPSSGLSTEEVDQLREQIARINKSGLAVLLVSHDMDLMSMVDRVHVLSAGEIIAAGTMQEMNCNPQVQQVYLGL